MKSYENYKDSGVDWIGEIPLDWSVSKLKFLSNISFSSVDRHEYNEELSVKICHYPDAYKNDKINAKTNLSSGTCTETEYEKFQLKRGQVIITKDSESANDIGVPTYIEETIENAVCGYHLAILEPVEEKISGKYLFRYIQSNDVSIYFENNSNGVTRFGLGKPKIENLFVAHPSLIEQTQIAAFLDYKTNLIDTIIEKKKQLIVLLKEKRQAVINEAVTKGLNPNAKMKNSGVEWLGDIPEGWSVLNFRYVIDILTDFTANGSFGDLAKNVKYLDEGYSRLVRLTDLREELENKGIYVSEESHNYLSKSSLYGNEILLANVGAYAGLAWKVPQLNNPATLGPNMFLLKFNERTLNDFGYYSLISEYLFSQLKNKSTSSAQPKLNKEDVRSILFILPSLEDQIEIINYIEIQSELYNNLISKSEASIQNLQTYRQSLISEAVTGKIDVRDWQPSTKNR